jgi:hypothetical protein
LSLPTYLAISDLVAVLPAIGLGYYALRMFFLTRFGRLERGWKMIIMGALASSFGFLALTVQDLTQAYSFGYILTDYVGTLSSACGFFLVMLGIRSQYSVWSLKNFPGVSEDEGKRKNSNDLAGRDTTLS